MKAWKAILAALVIFGAGVVTGGLTVRLKAPKAVRPPSGESAPMPWSSQQRTEYLSRMQRHLNLTPAQNERIEKWLQESQERMKKMWEPVAPQAREEFRSVREQILLELNPEQKKKYEEVFKPRSAHKPGEPREELRKRDERRDQRPMREPPPADGKPRKSLRPQPPNANDQQ